jgi:hypothetical protein
MICSVYKIVYVPVYDVWTECEWQLLRLGILPVEGGLQQHGLDEGR